MSDTLSYTGSLVRQNDPERFFLSLLQPAALRPALWALLALHQEIAKTREVVSEPTLGYMRLQWWRESIQSLFEGTAVSHHDILGPLAAAIQTYHLPQALFEQMLTGREYDLGNNIPATMEELNGYIGGVVTPLTEMILKVTGERPDGAAMISNAYGISGVMRSIPCMARQGRSLLPRECGTVDELFLDRTKRQEVLTMMHNAACQSLLDAGSFSSKWLKGMARTTHICLRHMQRLDFNVLDERFSAQPPFLQIRLLLG
ncbi:MAG: squalene/phytoene synthase family protein [Micavibrio aeruginosavorus]|uniref:Squalene/phytoene synthase family protein n=1 Tax=Micavibrio aeruginosavorus TaxID=349221 RepID=A0A7T5R439_9BACT|nr:MAG: squalene/phytoene synthase family protein [Micavibrio aeruginosavorus]